MNEKPRDAGDPIDDLVRRYLEHQAEREQCEPLIERVLGTIEGTDADKPQSRPVRAPTSTHGQRLWTRSLWLAAAAATVLFAFVVGRWGQPAYAEASVLVRAALATHAGPVERCYTVTVERDAEIQEEQPQFRDVRIWTQGDRFWVDVRGQRAWKWGRSSSGAIWIALRRHRALEIEADEIGPPLQQIADLYSLHLETLLENVLNHFQLAYSDNGSFTHVITAQPRGWTSGYIREAVIEVDKETKAVKRLELQRSFPRRGDSRITFTLVDARTADDSKYEPAGHLDEPFRILTRDLDPDKRRDVLTSWFGPQAARWLVESPSSSTSQEN
jgi:hypothetical protein